MLEFLTKNEIYTEGAADAKGPVVISDGWIRKPDARDIKKYTSEDNEKLEEEVLRELGYI